MRRHIDMSRLYAPTLKEDPAEAELASHRLLLRAGMIRKAASGLYSYLPLAWRSIRKIEQIVREEMEAIGCQEMQVPILTDADLWRQSGRWNDYGKELMRVRDRHDRDFALGPTHEEAFTDLVRGELRSYKQLPLMIYQMQDKFRDELRPRFGLMRGREFIMKDAYSFAATPEQSRECYEAQKAAYARICERCGLRALPVAADTGQIGGDTSVEFMALADAGEAELVYSDCGWAADVEAATAPIALVDGAPGALEKVETPGCSTIADLAQFLGVPAAGLRKALALVTGDGRPVVVFVPGDHEMNDVKAGKLFGDYHMMSDEEIGEYGLVKGFIGPVGLPEGVRALYDVSLRSSAFWVVGANEPGFHYLHAMPQRDFYVDNDADWVDVIAAQEGDLCPECGEPLRGARGIEVSQVFLFDDKYSTPMHATFMAEDGTERPFLMGSYGVGVSRTLAAVVEQHHDEHGICWPVPVAPYEVEVVPLSVGDDVVWPVAQALTAELEELDVEVALDDRKERAGVKFADADLMGFPYQVVLGKRGVAAGTAEVKDRATGERTDVPLAEAAAYVEGLVAARRA